MNHTTTEFVNGIIDARVKLQVEAKLEHLQAMNIRDHFDVESAVSDALGDFDIANEVDLPSEVQQVLHDIFADIAN